MNKSIALSGLLFFSLLGFATPSEAHRHANYVYLPGGGVTIITPSHEHHHHFRHHTTWIGGPTFAINTPNFAVSWSENNWENPRNYWHRAHWHTRCHTNYYGERFCQRWWG